MYNTKVYIPTPSNENEVATRRLWSAAYAHMCDTSTYARRTPTSIQSWAMGTCEHTQPHAAEKNTHTFGC